MNFSALVMAGGRGTRLGGEKALVKVVGISMLNRVVQALLDSKNVERIIVTSSPFTPQTSKEAHKLGVEVLITPGNGYVEDMKYAVNTLNLRHALVINSDLPFINPSIIDRVTGLYEESKKQALTVMLPESKCTELGFAPSYTTEMGSEKLAPAGLNVVDGEQIGNDEVPQEVVVMRDVLPFINVNNFADLEKAEIMLLSV